MKLLLYRKSSWLILSLFLVAQTHGQQTAVKKKVLLPVPDRIDNFENDVTDSLEDLEGLSYDELNDLRAPRKLLLDYLKADGKIRESPKGTIDFLAQINDIGRLAVKEENRTRKQMFSLLASLEKRSISSIGREFHQEISADPEEKPTLKAPVADIPASLRISSPLSIGNTLVSGLITGYLESLGYGDVKTSKKGKITRVIGSRTFGTGQIAVDVEPLLPEAGELPDDKCVLFEAGGANGVAPPNTIAFDAMAIVVHKDNPVTSLTLSQVADIFAGKIEGWGKLSGKDEDISVLLPGARPVLNEQFKDLVMEPEREKFLSGEAKSDFLSLLEKDPGAITFCHASELRAKMKPVRLRASDDSLPLAPSNINVKALDYRLVTRISLRSVKSTDSFMKDFIAFSQSPAGQKAVADSGFISNLTPSEKEQKDAVVHREFLLASEEVPQEYKDLIKNADRLNSSSNIRFVEGTTTFELTEHSQLNLDRLTQFLMSHRNRKTILIGFADDEGDETANKIYSTKRADSIAEKLKAKGITNIETAGMGEEMPVGDNDSLKGRISNRRVEVWIE